MLICLDSFREPSQAPHNPFGTHLAWLHPDLLISPVHSYAAAPCSQEALYHNIELPVTDDARPVDADHLLALIISYMTPPNLADQKP